MLHIKEWGQTEPPGGALAYLNVICSILGACLGKLGYIGVHTFLSTQVKPPCPTLVHDSRLYILRIKNSKICTSKCEISDLKKLPFCF